MSERYTILDGRGVPIQIGTLADSPESALRIFGTNHAGGPYTARLETPAEAERRERNAERDRQRYPIRRHD